MSREPDIITGADDAGAVYDRAVEICALITPTASSRSAIELSALLGAACFVIAAQQGMECTDENLSRILHMVIRKVHPAIEAELGLPEWN